MYGAKGWKETGNLALITHIWEPLRVGKAEK